jgi:tetratricopeptide (TPR) repeat protein
VSTWRLSLRVIFISAAALLVLAGAALRGTAWAAGTGANEEANRAAIARALFAEGLAHADAHRWAEAADRFERAAALRPTPVITYNLSTAWERLGDLVRAQQLLRQIASDPQAAAEVKDAARTRLSALGPRLAFLTIETPGRRAPQSTVTIDGHKLEDGALGVAVPVNPASHSIELLQQATVIGSRQVLLHEGERQTVILGQELPILLPATAAASETRAVDRFESQRHGWAWVVVAAVVVGAATAAIVATRTGDPGPSGTVATWTLGAQ